MKKALSYKTLETLWIKDWKLAAKIRKKAIKRKALTAGLIEQATNAKTDIERINANANYEAHFKTLSRAVSNEWYEALKPYTLDDVLFKVWASEEPLTVGEYLEQIASKAPSEKDALPNLANAILA